MSSSVPDVCFQFSQLSVDEILHQLQHLDAGKATGSDDISAFFLGAPACEITEPLTIIFNKSLDTGLVPSIWKYSNISPIHKGEDKDDLGLCPLWPKS